METIHDVVGNRLITGEGILKNSNSVKNHFKANGTHDFRGQISGVYILAPLMNTTKYSTDFAMGHPPVCGVHFSFFSPKPISKLRTDDG